MKKEVEILFTIIICLIIGVGNLIINVYLVDINIRTELNIALSIFAFLIILICLFMIIKKHFKK